MSNVYIDAADAIRRAAKQYEVYTKAAEVLEHSGSFVQAAEEAKLAAAAAVEERVQAEADLVKALAATKKAREQGKQLWEDAQAKAKAHIEEVTAAARTTAADIVRTAEGNAVNIVAGAQAQVQAVAANAEALAKEVAELAAKQVLLAADIKEKEAKVGALDAALAKLREKLG